MTQHRSKAVLVPKMRAVGGGHASTARSRETHLDVGCGAGAESHKRMSQGMERSMDPKRLSSSWHRAAERRSNELRGWAIPYSALDSATC